MGFGGGTKLKLLLYGPQTVVEQESGE